MSSEQAGKARALCALQNRWRAERRVTAQAVATYDEAYTFHLLLRFCLALFAKGAPFVTSLDCERAGAILASQAEKVCTILRLLLAAPLSRNTLPASILQI
jgi:hypothetical protein